MGFLLVLRAELVRSLIILRRYWFATIIGILIGYGMLAMLAYAFLANREAVTQGLSGGFGSTAINGTLGVLIGMLGFSIVGMFSQGLQAMARSGELEQLYMSPHGLITNFLARSFVSSITTVLSMALMLWLVDQTVAKGSLKIDGTDLLLLILIISLTYVNLIGFGYMIGGLTLVFKQTGQVATIIRLILWSLAVLAKPEMVEWPPIAQVLAHILPITDAAVCLKLVIIQDKGTQIFGPEYIQFFLFLVLNSIVWTTLGIVCFKIMERWSRSKGTLGAY